MHYVIASSIRHAEDSAAIDWGWRLSYGRNGARGALAPDGEFAMFVSCADSLRGISEKPIIYLGHGWGDVPGVFELLTRHRIHGGAILFGDGSTWW